MKDLVQIERSAEEHLRLPEWLRRKPGSSSDAVAVKQLLRKSKLHTVCEEARCPNISECFGRKTATFMILGDICTRGCRFCSVTTGKPSMPRSDFAAEAESVAAAAQTLGLRHVVVTSVARDDLADGGASGFAATILALKALVPKVVVEVLIPDFRGSEDPLRTVIDAGPNVLNHNLETVPRLYRRVRPGSGYRRSLELLRRVKSHDSNISTKTGIMLGLGETEQEVREVLHDCREVGVDIITAGQYMRPSRSHLPVSRYVPPEEFESYKRLAEEMGFSRVFFGPLVRSSYHADEVFGE